MLIRALDIAELGQAADLIRNGFGTVAEAFGLTAENCPTNGAFIKADRLVSAYEKGILMFGAFLDGIMIGFISLDKKNETQIELEKITILPEFRHLGYGKTLLAYAKNTAAGLGANKITIGIIEENAVLKSWYIKNGFISTGTTSFEHLPFTVGFMEFAF